MTDAPIAVVGAGWSGISAAWTIHKMGRDVLLIDATDFLGGRCRVQALGDTTVVLGGKNIGRRYRHFRELIAELEGGTYEHFGLNSTRVGPSGTTTVDDRSRLASIRGLFAGIPPRDIVKVLRMVLAVGRDDTNRWLRGPYFRSRAGANDIALSEYFGEALLASLVRTVTVRMNGAEPEEAYVGNFGANLGMLLDTFDQLTQGFAGPYTAIADTLPTRLGHQVIGIETGTDRATLTLRTAGGDIHQQSASHVVLALTAGDAAPLVEQVAPTAGRALGQISYHPAAVVVARHEANVFSPGVRALTFPRGTALSNAGAYGEAQLELVRYTLSGTEARGFLEGQPAAETLLERALSDASTQLPDLAGNQVLDVTSQHWSRALCSYGPRHSDRLDLLDSELLKIPRLSLAGDYLLGTSLEACCRSGMAAATAATIT